MDPRVQSFYDQATSTFTYLVYDEDGGHAAIVDPVLDFDSASARTSTASADAALSFAREHRLTVDWILETHAHDDHLTAAAYIRRNTGAKVAIGHGITKVQERFKALFGLGPEFATDGSQFDRLFAEGDTSRIGTLEARVISTPGHTDDSLTYVIGDSAFIGDTCSRPRRAPHARISRVAMRANSIAPSAGCLSCRTRRDCSSATTICRSVARPRRRHHLLTSAGATSTSAARQARTRS